MSDGPSYGFDTLQIHAGANQISAKPVGAAQIALNDRNFRFVPLET